MEIPVYDGGEKAGRMRIGREGLYTVFEARLPPSEELTRLWLAGAGKSAYLGLMEPREEGRLLRRRLSALELRGLPEKPEYACTAQPPAPPPERETERESAPAAKGDSHAERERVLTGGEPEVPEDASETAEPGESAGPDGEAGGDGESAPEAAGPGPPRSGPETDLLWFSRPDGSLSAFDGRSQLLALPARLRRKPPGIRVLTIDGREYLVFRT